MPHAHTASVSGATGYVSDESKYSSVSAKPKHQRVHTGDSFGKPRAISGVSEGCYDDAEEEAIASSPTSMDSGESETKVGSKADKRMSTISTTTVTFG